MKNATVDFINQSIKRYGSNTYGDPIFRVVFSDDQTEKRKGVFRDFHSKIILIREIEEIREVKKYPWIKGRWILERWAPGEISHHEDLITDKDGVYICVYTFQDRNKNYLPPLLKVCDIVILHLLNPQTKSQSLSQDAEIEKREDELEVNKIEEDLKIQSDLVASKDSKSSRETASVGYVKDKI